MIVATINDSIIPKRVKNGLPFVSQAFSAVEGPLSEPILTINAEIRPDNKNTIIFVGAGSNLDTNFSGYCTLIYEV